MAASNAGTSAASDAADREIVVTRVFEAPRELVFEAWTDPKHVVEWWGPNGFSTTIHEMDVRPGGIWRLTMRGPDGRDYNNRIVFIEVAKPGRLVYKHESEKGSEPVSFQTTVTFAERGDKTEVTVRMLFPSAQAREHVVKKYGAIDGLNQTLGRLEAHLGTLIAEQDEFVITRTFDAPRELVFKAFSEAERLALWWGPKGFTWVTGKLALRPGGLFHYCMRAPNGQEMWGKFVYREISAPERIVFVNSFSNEKGETVRAPFHANWPLEVMNTLTLAEREGKTALTLRGHPIHATEAELKAFKDGYKSMQQGFGAMFDQLSDYLAKQEKDTSMAGADNAGGARWSKKRELVIERVFNAPRELVFQAWTKPEHMMQWWGPRGFTLPTCEMEFRAGGEVSLGHARTRREGLPISGRVPRDRGARAHCVSGNHPRRTRASSLDHRDVCRT